MLLVVDVGNSQTVLGLYDGEQLAAHWRFTTARNRTEDELRMLFRAMLELDGFSEKDVTGVAVSSVVPAVTAALRTAAADLAPEAFVVVEPGVKTGMAIHIDNPREVGADRVVNAVAARHRYGAPVVSVDFGTSTNVDVVGPDGDYLGGAIAPGLAISTDALISGTAALRKVEFVPPRSPIGKGTVEAIQSGALYGHAGLVDGIVGRIVAELGGEVTVVATGGMASTIVPHCSTVGIVDEFLTLDGLRLVYDLNHGPDAS
ncbi:MAG: type III pantothenate kinase [Acidimicrobiia bacterium]